jgi:hypothetical protein
MHAHLWRNTEAMPRETPKHVVRALLLLIVLGALAIPAGAQSLEILGYAGVLGEWELTATVTKSTSPGGKEFSGPLLMKHVGICSQDGPEDRIGEIRLQLSSRSSRLDATLSIGGVECVYSGTLSDSYTGAMTCPERPPIPLTLWVK